MHLGRGQRLELAVAAALLAAVVLVVATTLLTRSTLQSTRESLTAAADLRAQVFESHLWLEESLAGDRSVDVDREVIGPLAGASAACAGFGDEAQAGSVLRLDAASIARAREPLCASLSELRALTERRLGMRRGAPGTESDADYDRSFARAISQADELVGAIRAASAGAERRLDVLNAAAIVLLVAVIVAAAVLSAAHRRRLRAMALRNQLIIDSAGDGVYALDAGGRVVLANRAALQMTGHSHEDLMGRIEHEVVHHSRPDGSPYPASECPTMKALATGEPQRVDEDVYWRGDGTSFPVEYTTTPICENGTVTGAVVVFRDATERRELDEMKARFMSTVGHELRTPLASLRGSLDLLASGGLGGLSDSGRRMLDIAVENTDRLLRLVNDILDIERMEKGQVAMDVQPCDGADLAERAAAVMEGLARTKGVELSRTVHPVTLDADPDRIVQALTNLLSNAIKFSPAGSTVEVGVHRRGREAVFEVRDRGRGIPSDKLDSIFERFQQVEDGDGGFRGGTGLGLPISRSIVEQHGGRISVESAVGKGSTFSISLPASPVDPEREPESEPEGPLVLVCDSDAKVRDAVVRTLRRNGYRSLQAATPDEAVAQAQRRRPDVVLLDLLMAHRDGWNVTQALNRIPSFAGVPIVVLSVRGRAAPPRTEAVPFPGRSSIPIDEAVLIPALERATGRGGRGAHVLVVEDDPGLAAVITLNLERSGCTVAPASSGEQALAKSRERTPDLIVLDLGLAQDEDGEDVLDVIRRDVRLSRIPIVVYTGRQMVGASLEHLRRRGVTDVLSKGHVTPEQLEARVVRMLRSVTGQPGEGDDRQADTRPGERTGTA